LARDWIWGAWRSSAKMKVFGAEVARVMRSAAARGEEADLVRARKGCSCQYLKKLRVSTWIQTYFQSIQSFCLLHSE